MAHARNGYISTSGLKADVTIVFLVVVVVVVVVVAVVVYLHDNNKSVTGMNTILN